MVDNCTILFYYWSVILSDTQNVEQLRKRLADLEAVVATIANSGWSIERTRAFAKRWAEYQGETNSTLPDRDDTVPQTAQGIYRKYHVHRVDGQPLTTCYVLELGRDPYAVVALQVYANECRDEYPHLANDVETLIRSISESKAKDTIELRLQKTSLDALE